VLERERHDTIIIGAGPCGFTVAKELAKKDRDVLVLEKIIIGKMRRDR